jgi:asparagine synthetase B (glutamine-hydrolysing)
VLSNHSRRRGVDSSGFVYFDNDYNVLRANYDIRKLLRESQFGNSSFAMGHSRLVTNGLNDNQPVIREGIIVIHNGIITNENEVWENIDKSRNQIIDTEAINAVVEFFLDKNQTLNDRIFEYLNKYLKGTVSTAIAVPKLGKLILYSNNGSLYYVENKEGIYFASEAYPLQKATGQKAVRLLNEGIIKNIPLSEDITILKDSAIRKEDLIPTFRFDKSEEEMLEFNVHNLRRCSKCILPETMPFIEFDEYGLCNYCRDTKPLNKLKSKQELIELISPYKGAGDYDCVVPFSGGRDSCYSLHIIVKELGLKPLTFTYDWGMFTDLARDRKRVV